eukprot:bmy_20654T0
MTFAELVDRVASKGPFQFLHTVLLGLPILSMANHNLLQIFTAATPAHHCRPPPNASAGPWVLPMGLNEKPEPCLRFVYPPNASLPNDTQGATEPCLDGWTYDVSTRDSIVTEVPGGPKSAAGEAENPLSGPPRSSLSSQKSPGFAGHSGPLFGRKPILTCSYLLLAASGSGAAFSPTLPIYTVFRFLCGCGISGITLSTTILSVEWVSTRMRAIKSISLGYFYTSGQFILPGLAYAIPQWRWLQLTVSIPFFAFFLLSWWLPESIRWMILSGRSSKALKTFRQVAAFNGKKEEGEKLSLELVANGPLPFLCPKEIKLNLQKEITLAKAKHSIADLFRTPILRRVTFCLSLACLAMGVEEFGVNLYVLQLIFGGVDVPAKFITMVSISYLGRHTTEAVALLLAGGCILSLIFVPSDLLTLRTVLAVFGKGCLSSSFSCLFLYTSELYPTVIRQTGMGINNLWTRVGSMTAPLVKITAELKPFIPNVIFGTIALLGGSAALFLPETLNRPLPETVEDLENWSLQAKEPKQEPEAENASQRIPLQPRELGLGPN